MPSLSSDIIGSPVSQSDSDISFIIISQEGSSTSTLHLIRKEGLVEKYKYHQTPDCIDIVLTWHCTLHHFWYLTWLLAVLLQCSPIAGDCQLSLYISLIQNIDFQYWNSSSDQREDICAGQVRWAKSQVSPPALPPRSCRYKILPLPATITITTTTNCGVKC